MVYPHRLKSLSSALIMLIVSGCAAVTEPLSIGERQALMQDTMKAVHEQELPANYELTLYDAMARALIYNFATRLDALEEDVAHDRIGSGYWDFLPQAVASAGVSNRSNTQASSSVSVTTGDESLESSSSVENTRQTADLRFTWNVLDFGVNYFNLKQTANQSLMAKERHKRVVRQLIQDVRSAYWRAVAAQRLLDDVTEMLNRVRGAIKTASEIVASRLQSPLDTLNYKRELFDKLLQLRTIRKGLLQSKLELAKLINIVPSTTFRLAIPAKLLQPTKDIGATPEQLSLIALQSRPEIIESGYNQRIAALEVKKSIARMFPGLEFSFSNNFDSNKYLLHQNWSEAGMKVTWNLINFLRGTTEIGIAKKQEKISHLRRQTLGMAVMAQVNIAYLDYDEAVTTYSTTNSLASINEQIEDIQRSDAESRNMGALQLIKLELNSLVAKLRRDEQYAQVQNAMGRLMFSTGVNIYNDLPNTSDIGVLASAISDAESAWKNNGMFKRQYGMFKRQYYADNANAKDAPVQSQDTPDDQAAPVATAHDEHTDKDLFSKIIGFFYD